MRKIGKFHKIIVLLAVICGAVLAYNPRIVYYVFNSGKNSYSVPKELMQSLGLWGDESYYLPKLTITKRHAPGGSFSSSFYLSSIAQNAPINFVAKPSGVTSWLDFVKKTKGSYTGVTYNFEWNWTEGGDNFITIPQESSEVDESSCYAIAKTYGTGKVMCKCTIKVLNGSSVIAQCEIGALDIFNIKVDENHQLAHVVLTANNIVLGISELIHNNTVEGIAKVYDYNDSKVVFGPYGYSSKFTSKFGNVPYGINCYQVKNGLVYTTVLVHKLPPSLTCSVTKLRDVQSSDIAEHQDPAWVKALACNGVKVFDKVGRLSTLNSEFHDRSQVDAMIPLTEYLSNMGINTDNFELYSDNAGCSLFFEYTNLIDVPRIVMLPTTLGNKYSAGAARGQYQFGSVRVSHGGYYVSLSGLPSNMFYELYDPDDCIESYSIYPSGVSLSSASKPGKATIRVKASSNGGVVQEIDVYVIEVTTTASFRTFRKNTLEMYPWVPGLYCALTLSTGAGFHPSGASSLVVNSEEFFGRNGYSYFDYKINSGGHYCHYVSVADSVYKRHIVRMGGNTDAFNYGEISNYAVSINTTDTENLRVGSKFMAEGASNLKFFRGFGVTESYQWYFGVNDIGTSKDRFSVTCNTSGVHSLLLVGRVNGPGWRYTTRASKLLMVKGGSEQFREFKLKIVQGVDEVPLEYIGVNVLSNNDVDLGISDKTNADGTVSLYVPKYETSKLEFYQNGKRFVYNVGMGISEDLFIIDSESKVIVKDSEGNPIKYVTVTVQDEDGKPYERLTDSEGVACFTANSGTKLNPIVHVGGKDFTQPDTPVSNTAPCIINFTLPGISKLTVLKNDEPYLNTPLTVGVYSETGDELHTGITDNEGCMYYTHPTDGEMITFKVNYRDEVLASDEIEAPGDAIVNIAGPMVKVNVFRKPTTPSTENIPLEDMPVYAYTNDDNGQLILLTEEPLITDANGQVDFNTKGHTPVFFKTKYNRSGEDIELFSPSVNVDTTKTADIAMPGEIHVTVLDQDKGADAGIGVKDVRITVLTPEKEVLADNATDNNGFTSFQFFDEKQLYVVICEYNGVEYSKNALCGDHIVFTATYDFDGDLIPDEWEYEHGLDPTKSNTDKDTDGDGLSDFKEYINDSNPKNTDSDGDGATDGEEADQGSNPNDPSDEGKGPPAELLTELSITLGDFSGSKSERWGIKVADKFIQSESFGSVDTVVDKFKLGEVYELKLTHLATKLSQPDYDYEFGLSGSDGYILIDDSNFVGQYYHARTMDWAAKSAKLYLTRPDIGVDSNNDGYINDDDRDLEEDSPGMVVMINDDNDNEEEEKEDNSHLDCMDKEIDGEDDKEDLVEIKLALPAFTKLKEEGWEPSEFKLTMSGAGKIRIFKDKDSGEVLLDPEKPENPDLWELFTEKNQETITVYAEGVETGEVELNITLSGDNGTDGTTVIGEDNVKITVVKMEFVVPSEYDENGHPAGEPVTAPFLLSSTPKPTLRFNGEVTADIVGDNVVVHLPEVFIYDPVADNIPRDKGTDIQSLEYSVNNSAKQTLDVSCGDDGAATFWRQHPYKGTVSAQDISIPLQAGINKISFETGENLAGFTGTASLTFNVVDIVSGGSIGAKTNTEVTQHNILIANDLLAESVDNIVYYTGFRNPYTEEHPGDDGEVDLQYTENSVSGLDFSVVLADGTKKTVIIKKAIKANPSYDPQAIEGTPEAEEYVFEDADSLQLNNAIQDAFIADVVMEQADGTITRIDDLCFIESKYAFTDAQGESIEVPAESSGLFIAEEQKLTTVVVPDAPITHSWSVGNIAIDTSGLSMCQYVGICVEGISPADVDSYNVEVAGNEYELEEYEGKFYLKGGSRFNMLFYDQPVSGDPKITAYDGTDYKTLDNNDVKLGGNGVMYKLKLRNGRKFEKIKEFCYGRITTDRNNDGTISDDDYKLAKKVPDYMRLNNKFNINSGSKDFDNGSDIGAIKDDFKDFEMKFKNKQPLTKRFDLYLMVIPAGKPLDKCYKDKEFCVEKYAEIKDGKLKLNSDSVMLSNIKPLNADKKEVKVSVCLVAENKKNKSQKFVLDYCDVMVVYGIGNKHYFHAANDYIEENNTKFFLDYYQRTEGDKAQPDAWYVVVMREDKTEMKMINAVTDQRTKIFTVIKDNNFSDCSVIINGGMFKKSWLEAGKEIIGSLVSNGKRPDNLRFSPGSGYYFGMLKDGKTYKFGGPGKALNGIDNDNSSSEFPNENLYDELDEEGNLKAGVFKEALGGVGDAFNTGGKALRNLLGRANIVDKNNKQQKLLIVTQSDARKSNGKVVSITDFVNNHLKSSGVYKSLNLDGGSSVGLAIDKSGLKVINAGSKHKSVRIDASVPNYVGFKCNSIR